MERSNQNRRRRDLETDADMECSNQSRRRWDLETDANIKHSNRSRRRRELNRQTLTWSVPIRAGGGGI